MRAIRRCILAFALLLAVPAAVPAQVGVTTDVITGRVLGPDGEPLAAASVTATSLESGIRRSTLTNAQGRYTLIFPDGGGRYQIEATYLGMSPTRHVLMRVADEDVLVANLQMEISPITLEGLEVTATRGARPAQREPGTQERVLPGEALNRLPIDATDLEALATLAPGVVGLAGGDTLGLAFSVLGQGPGANQVALDGMSFGGEGMGGFGLGVPQEAVRFTRVVTNTYDVARGQFSGGQIASTTRSGTNQLQGSFNYQLRDPALQWTGDDSPFGGAFRQNRLSGGLGGPIIRDRLFYFGSFGLQRRSEGLQSLLSADPASLQRLGANPDSVARFLSILNAQGIYPPGVDGVDGRTGDALTLLGRLDYHLTERHTLSLRADGRRFTQDPFRVGALGLPQTGGTMETTGGGAMLTLSSRFTGGWINELRAYVSGDSREMEPYFALPEGRVRVTSELDDGTRSVSTLVFGGGTMGLSSSSRNLEISNELSLLWRDAHRIRIGAMVNATQSTQQTAANHFGSFTFNSLADFEAGRAASFTRSLTTRERESGGINAALYLGDTWRPSRQLQLTYGVRLEGSAVAAQPAYNPEVETLFGRRTDAIPSELHLSPRVGFTYTLGMREGAAPIGVLRGGFGEFRNRPSWNLFANARDATGLPDAQVQLFCAGAATPVPEWSAYLDAPGMIPASCSGGELLTPTSGRGTSVSVFGPDFGAARSWRASLGFQRRVLQFLGISIDATYAQGVNLTGVRDLNLNTEPAFMLAQEDDRPVFVAPTAIVPGTGEVGFFGSRVHEQFGNVLEMHSDLRSHTGQLTLGVNGFVPPLRMFFQTNYTYSQSRDQGASGGFGGFGGRGFGGMGFGGGTGFGGASLPTTAANPNEPDWATSDFDRRHSIIATLGRQVRPWLDLTLIGRFTSGAPFTPLVGGDINGDGARNDRAFIFDPAAAADPLLAEGMGRLLEAAPDRVRSCLETQMGSIAERNSCRGPWSQALDLRANVRPDLPGLGRRLMISVDAVNSLTGLDQLLHGTDGMRGWGQQSRPDPVLLYPRGFDAATQSFHYEVNERFGASRQGALALRNPFQLQIQAQISVGRQPAGMMGMGGPGGMRGGRGGMGGMGAGAPGAAGRPDAGGPQGMLDRALANPVAQILDLRDTLGLSEEQVAALRPLADTLQTTNDEIRTAVQRQMQAAAAGGDPGEGFRALQPQLQRARTARQGAMEEAQRVLTAEQWERVPEEIRNPPQPQMRGGGRPRG